MMGRLLQEPPFLVVEQALPSDPLAARDNAA